MTGAPTPIDPGIISHDMMAKMINDAVEKACRDACLLMGDDPDDTTVLREAEGDDPALVVPKWREQELFFRLFTIGMRRIFPVVLPHMNGPAATPPPAGGAGEGA